MRPHCMRRGSILIGSDVFRRTGLCSFVRYYFPPFFTVRPCFACENLDACVEILARSVVQIGRTANIIANRRDHLYFLFQMERRI
jgi:hypothetical protein